jgi:diguanylate cyclase (GGDEF)-like protein
MSMRDCIAGVNSNFQRLIGDFDSALRVNLSMLVDCLGVDRAALYLLREKETVAYPEIVMTRMGEIEASGFISVAKNARNDFSRAVHGRKTVVRTGHPEYGAYIPLFGDDGPVGVLKIDNFRLRRGINPVKAKDFSLFAEPFQQGVANCLTYLRFHNQIKKLTTLMRIAGVMTIALKLDEILKITLTSLVKDMGYDRAQIFLADEDSGTISRNVSYDFRDKYESRERVSEKVEPYLAESGSEHGSKKYSSEVICYTPMFWKGKKIGVLIVDNLFSREVLKEDDLSFLGILANQLGILIENSLLFEKVEQSSITDGLTGLYNHRQFYQLLSEEIARADRGKNKLSLLICDLDHFKKFNDTYGHQAGDKALMVVADTLRRSIRAIDIAFRYGGEEFAVILPGADALHSRMIAERISDNIRKAEIVIGKKSVKGTVSIGIAAYPDDSAEKNDLVRKADQAMYWSKEHGRDMITVYSKKNIR